MSPLSLFSALAKSFQKSSSDRVNHLQSFTKYLRNLISVFQQFLLELTKFSLWKEDWALG